MKIERSTDYASIRSLLTDERAYRRMASDTAPSPCEFPQDLPEGLEYVTVSDDKGLAAVFVLIPKDPKEVEVHFCFNPRTWGRTQTIANAFIAWLWHETGALSATGPIPGYNSLALKLAEISGFKQYWREIDAVHKNGKLYDLIHTRIQRPAA